MTPRLVLGIIASLALLAVACDEERSYPTNLDDDKYYLAGMALPSEDAPIGMEEYTDENGDPAEVDFDNQDWAEAFSDDPEVEANRLDAIGRLTAHLKFFVLSDPLEKQAGPRYLISQSTLYTEAKSASEDMRASASNSRASCGVLINDGDDVREFSVPRFGDEATGFLVFTRGDQSPTTVDTVVCFRTGRILHAVVQSGLNGSQDIGLSVRVAQRMLIQVDDVFDHPNNYDDDPDNDDKPKDDEKSG